MSELKKRDQVWSSLDRFWDILIVGGGITGAGILREAGLTGLSAALLEARDFASGTSSRSSKLIHGGLRYLNNAQVRLTYESVRERERLLKEARGLVNPLGFLMACYRGDPVPRGLLRAGLVAYDLLARKWGHRYYDAYDLCELCPSLSSDQLHGGFRYFDAQTDDARLVLRVLQDSSRPESIAVNYAKVTRLLQRRDGTVCGVVVEDQMPGREGHSLELQASLVVNATGAWADDLRERIGAKTSLRRLRGSHLVFPAARFPLTRALSIWHPEDGRPVFAFPWEGVTLVGTTDVEQGPEEMEEPVIAQVEVDYLMRAVEHTFPCLSLDVNDIQATFAGVRTVINTGKTNPSKESRKHVVWLENGLLTVAGGKLTTFRLMARDALRLAFARVSFGSRAARIDLDQPVFKPPPSEAVLDTSLSRPARVRLLGRYGECAMDVAACAQEGELTPVDGTQTLWAEVRWGARAEWCVHLDDLLLRRVRLGLILPHGGLYLLDRLKDIVQPELGWSDERWGQEVKQYRQLWESCYVP